MPPNENSTLSLSGITAVVGAASTLVGVVPGASILLGALPLPSEYRPLFGWVLGAIGVTVVLLGYASIYRLLKQSRKVRPGDESVQQKRRREKMQRCIATVAAILCLLLGIAGVVGLNELLRQSVIVGSGRGSGEFVFPLPSLAEGELRKYLDDGDDYQTILNEILGAGSVERAIDAQSAWASGGTTFILVGLLSISALLINTSFVLTWRILAQAELAAKT